MLSESLVISGHDPWDIVQNSYGTHKPVDSYQYPNLSNETSTDHIAQVVVWVWVPASYLDMKH